MDNVLVSGANAMPVQASADMSSSDDWSYAAAAGGIVNTTAVTLAATPPAGSGRRNVLGRLDVENAHASVDTEVTVLDGATVLWRRLMKSGNGSNSSISLIFTPPLRASVGGAITAVCVTTGSQVYINAGGRLI